jgi:hypothetical protein
VILFKDCVKIKRYLPEMVGEKLGKGNVSHLCINVAVRVTFEHDTPYSLALKSRFGKSTCLLIILDYKITNWYCDPCVIFESVFPRSVGHVIQYVQKDVQPEKPSIASAISAVFKPSHSALAIPESKFQMNHFYFDLTYKFCYSFHVTDGRCIKALL